LMHRARDSALAQTDFGSNQIGYRLEVGIVTADAVLKRGNVALQCLHASLKLCGHLRRSLRSFRLASSCAKTARRIASSFVGISSSSLRSSATASTNSLSTLSMNFSEYLIGAVFAMAPIRSCVHRRCKAHRVQMATHTPFR